MLATFAQKNLSFKSVIYGRHNGGGDSNAKCSANFSSHFIANWSSKFRHIATGKFGAKIDHCYKLERGERKNKIKLGENWNDLLSFSG